ncbi:MAG: hypothetical protein ACQEQF_11745 [Bacillota bacterium]
MKHLSKEDYRQFITEIEFLGKEKEFSSGIIDEIKSLKSIINLKNKTKVLEKKRKAYDYAFIKIFQKYSIPYDNIYEELDKLWRKNQIPNIIIKCLFTSITTANPSYHPSPTSLKKAWNNYKDSSIDLAQKYGKEVLKNSE